MERENRQPRITAPNHSTIWLIAASILVHLAFLALLNRPFDSIRKDKSQATPVIRARLYFPPSAKPDPIKQSEPVSPLPEDVTPQTPTPKEPVKAESEQMHLKQQLLQEPLPPENNRTEVADKLSDESPKKKANATQLKRAFRRIGQQSQSKIQQMAEQAAAEYRRHKNSPVIAPATISELSEDEKLLKGISKNANCDDVARKTTATVLTLLGAKINCTAKPDLQPFINKRLQKVGATK